MRKNNKIKIGIFALVVIACIVGIIIYSNSSGQRLQRQLNLGQKYLNELNYEQAVVAYELALEIDPLSAEAYLGLAEAYVAQDNYEKAVEILQKGYEITGNEDIKKQLDICSAELERRKEASNKKNEEIKPEEKESEENNKMFVDLGFSVWNFTFMGEVAGPEFYERIKEKAGLNTHYPEKEVHGTYDCYGTADEKMMSSKDDENPHFANITMIWPGGNFSSDVNQYYFLSHNYYVGIHMDETDVKTYDAFYNAPVEPGMPMNDVLNIIRYDEILEKSIDGWFMVMGEDGVERWHIYVHENDGSIQSISLSPPLKGNGTATMIDLYFENDVLASWSVTIGQQYYE